MKNLKLFIATLLAATSMIACSKDKGGGGNGACQAGYVQTDYNWIQQNGYNLPQNAYYQSGAVNGQNQYAGGYYGGSQVYCVQQQYYNGYGNNYGGNNQYCQQYPQDPSCQGGSQCQYNPYAPGCQGGGNNCQYNPYAPGCNGGGGGNFCYYYPNHPTCWYGYYGY